MLGAGVAASAVAPALRTKAEIGGKAARKDNRPSFLFVICDDLMYRTIGSLNNPEVKTPNLDRLVADGCAFTHCFHQGSWSGAVCIPSRTMLVTGLSAFHAESGLDKVHLWGQTLGAAGYDTYICGKWHLDPTTLARSFKEMGPVAPGFLESTPVSGSAYNRPSPGNPWDPTDPKFKGHWIHTGLWLDEPHDRVLHSSTLFADSVIDHIANRAAKREAPFLIYLGLNAPHDPRQSPPAYLDLYPQASIELPPNYLPEHPFDQGDARVRDELLAPFPRTREAVQLHRREYYAIISHLDHEVGRILDALRASGRAENTYVIFTADHGLAVGEHGLMGKQNLYDCSVRIPLLVVGPKVAPGRKVDDLVYQHSVFPTVCEIAGIATPKTVEFPSLAPLLFGDSTPVHEAVFCYYRDFQRSVRTTTHKLIVYPKIKRMQLFDLVADPWEMNDLSEDPAHASLRAELMAKLKKLQTELNDPLDLGSLT